MRLLLALFAAALLAGCDKPVASASPKTPDPAKPVVPPAPKPPEIVDLDPKILGNFEYVEKMVLAPDVSQWNGRRVRITGYINPTTQQVTGLTEFLLVKDRSACCFGKRPQINHYVAVTLLKSKVNYSQDSVTVVGTLKIEDRWDGDWQLGLYWIDDGEIATH